MALKETHRYLAAKLVGGLFAAVIAPIAVGLGLNLIQKKIDQATEPAKPAAAKDAGAAAKAHAEGPTIALFNGKDLAGFHTYLSAPVGETEPLGLDNDPDHVFGVNQRGVLRISGKEFGSLVTDEDFENYHLTVEYRWGNLRWPPGPARSGGAASRSTAPAPPARTSSTGPPGSAA
jgi:hypothetical protein